MASRRHALIFQGFPVSQSFLPNEMNFILNFPGSRRNTNMDGNFIGIAVRLQMRGIWHLCDLEPGFPLPFSQLLPQPPEPSRSPSSLLAPVTLSQSLHICFALRHLGVPPLPLFILVPSPQPPTKRGGPHPPPCLNFLHSTSDLLTYYVFYFIFYCPPETGEFLYNLEVGQTFPNMIQNPDAIRGNIDKNIKANFCMAKKKKMSKVKGRNKLGINFCNLYHKKLCVCVRTCMCSIKVEKENSSA